MSFILDALKKAEQERNLGRTPDLQAVHTLTEPVRRRFWPWLLAAALLLNAVLLGIMLLWFRAPDESPQQPPAAVSAPPSGADQVASTAVAAQPESAEPAAAPVDIPTTAPPTTPPLAVDRPPSTTPFSAPSSDFMPPPQPPTVAQAPPLQSMPAALRASLPTLNLDIHVYSDQPERRFVLINSKRYQQGEWLDEGPLLEAITADGVILRYQEQRFSLPVQY